MPEPDCTCLPAPTMKGGLETFGPFEHPHPRGSCSGRPSTPDARRHGHPHPRSKLDAEGLCPRGAACTRGRARCSGLQGEGRGGPLDAGGCLPQSPQQGRGSGTLRPRPQSPGFPKPSGAGLGPWEAAFSAGKASRLSSFSPTQALRVKGSGPGWGRSWGCFSSGRPVSTGVSCRPSRVPQPPCAP